MTGRRYDAADHDRIAGDAAALIAVEVIKAGSSSDIMVALESTVLGVLVVAERRLGIEREVTVERVELMVSRLYERLAGRDARHG